MRRRRGSGWRPTTAGATTSSTCLSGLPGYATVTPSGADDYVWARRPPTPCALQTRRRIKPDRCHLVDERAFWWTLTSPTARCTTWRCTSSTGTSRGGPSRCRPACASTRAGAEHVDNLVVPVEGVPGLCGERGDRDHDHRGGRDEQRPQRTVPRLRAGCPGHWAAPQSWAPWAGSD